MSASTKKTKRASIIRFLVGFVLQLLAVVDIASTDKLIGSSLVSTSELERTINKGVPTSYRLPTALSPLRYELELQPFIYGPDPLLFYAKGSVTILMRCNNATNKIVLNWNGTSVDQSSIHFWPENRPAHVEDSYDVFEEDKERQLITITLNDKMEVGGKYYIAMKFRTEIRNDVTGLFYSSFNYGNETVYVANTQLQPMFARSVFPCFDEPAMKATFKLTILRKLGYVSLSNTPIDSSLGEIKFSEENGIKFVKDVYLETPRMSTHSLAFVVCDMISWTNKSELGKDLDTITNNQTRYKFAIETGGNLTDFFNFLFERENMVTKPDQIELPDYGTTDNLGLNIYKESLLRYSKEEFNVEDDESVSHALSYGLAHEWFSDFISPSWWSDLWMTEGLSGYYEHLGVNFIHPEWKTLERFIIDKMHVALAYDGAHHIRPLFNQAEAPKDILEMFDLVAYKKAPSIIRMLSSLVGEGIFINATKNFLREHLLATFNHDDLFNEITKEAKKAGFDIDIVKIMDTWIHQTNYPLVTVMRDFNDHSVIHVRQERYLSNPSAKETGTYPSPYSYRWTIPLTFASSKEPTFKINARQIKYIDKDQHSIEVHLNESLPACADPNSWILANIFQQGYYRVNYQSGNWLALSRQLQKEPKVIPVINRAQIINDAWSLAKASYVSLSIALSTLEYLDKETEYLPWYSAWTELRFVDNMLYYTPLYGDFKAFMVDKLKKPYDYFIPLKNSLDHLTLLTRSLVVEQSCYYDIKGCATLSLTEVNKWMNDKTVTNNIDPNIKKTIYCQFGAGLYKSQDPWEFALKMFKKTESYSEKRYLLNALTCSRKPWQLNIALNLLIENSGMFTDLDAEKTILLVAHNKYGRHLAWDFYRVNYHLLASMYESLKCRNSLPKMVEYFNTELELKEAIAFRKYSCPEIGETIFQLDIVDKIKTNILWMKTNIPIIKQWLVDRKKPQ